MHIGRYINLKNIIILIIALSLVYFGVWCIFGRFIFFSGDADSARYLLSALSQSLAAIFALFFTIPLIALQMVAKKYGSEMYDIFFNKKTVLYMITFIISIVISFLLLGRIKTNIQESLDSFETHAINLLLILTIGILLYLIPYTIEVKEKLKPDRLLEKIKNDIATLIKERKLEEASKRVDAAWGIAIGSIRENDRRTFFSCVDWWTDMMIITEKSWIPNKLENLLPELFAIAADQSEKLAKDGLNRLEIKILDFISKKEENKAIKNIEYIDLACMYLNKHDNVIIYAITALREIRQWSIKEKLYKATMYAIKVLKNLINYGGKNKERIAGDVAQEIRNILTEILLADKKLGEEDIKLLKKGIDALIEIGYYIFEGVDEDLLSIIPLLSDENLDTASKVIIAKKILEYADIINEYQAKDLVILGAQIYQADKQNELNEIIKKKLKKAELYFSLNLSNIFEQAKDYANKLKIDVDIDSFKTFVFT